MVCMEWIGMEWNGVHGIEWHEIVCSKLMLDPPKSEPRCLQKSVAEPPMGTKIRFWEHLELQIGLPWTIWAAIGTL